MKRNGISEHFRRHWLITNFHVFHSDPNLKQSKRKIYVRILGFDFTKCIMEKKKIQERKSLYTKIQSLNPWFYISVIANSPLVSTFNEWIRKRYHWSPCIRLPVHHTILSLHLRHGQEKERSINHTINHQKLITRIQCCLIEEKM